MTCLKKNWERTHRCLDVSYLAMRNRHYIDQDVWIDISKSKQVFRIVRLIGPCRCVPNNSCFCVPCVKIVIYGKVQLDFLSKKYVPNLSFVPPKYP